MDLSRWRELFGRLYKNQVKIIMLLQNILIVLQSFSYGRVFDPRIKLVW